MYRKRILTDQSQFSPADNSLAGFPYLATPKKAIDMINTAAATPEACNAQRMATALETIAEDLHAPIDIAVRLNSDSGQPTAFDVALDLPAFHVPAKASTNESARSIAVCLDNWGLRLSAIAQQIRIRYPK